jgi:hypothetical protein
MSRFSFHLWTAVLACSCAFACSGSTPTTPSASIAGAGNRSVSASPIAATPAEPPFNLEAILRGDGFGLVRFRQERAADANIVSLDVWVRDLAPNSSYSLQRAVDTALDDVCTGSNWLTLGQGTAAEPIVTDDRGTGRAELWRDLSAFAPGTAFDIHFRVIERGTTNVVLESGCYRFVVRD